jgi:hypothetical protein
MALQNKQGRNNDLRHEPAILVGVHMLWLMISNPPVNKVAAPANTSHR